MSEVNEGREGQSEEFRRTLMVDRVRGELFSVGVPEKQSYNLWYNPKRPLYLGYPTCMYIFL